MATVELHMTSLPRNFLQDTQAALEPQGDSIGQAEERRN